MSSRNLLVVDDDPAVLELLTSTLGRDGRHVVGASDGHTALDEMERSPYDLLVAGLSRNGMDGLALMRRARLIRPETPVILTAEKADPARVLRAMRERAYSYFHKPLPPGAVSDMVQQALAASDWQNDIEVVSARPEWVALSLRCKMEACDRAVQFLREVYTGIPVPVREDIAAALRELLMNAIEHGGHQDPSNVVRVGLVHMQRIFIGRVQDPGTGFSLEAMPHAAIGNPPGSPIQHVEVRAEQGQRPGGFGILITRSLVDDLLYSERGNEVLFVKHLA